MGDDDVDLDRATSRAWRQFQTRLADHIATIVDDDVTIIGVESSLSGDAEGTAPYVQFCAWGDDLVRAEVSSNEYLDAEVALDAAGERALIDLGWGRPTRRYDETADSGSANFHVDAQRREADRVAAITVAALRDVFGVPHPAFVDWPSDTESDDDWHVDAVDADDADDSDDGLAVLPESIDHLRTLVLDALTTPDGPGLEVDEDGDIPVPTGSALLFVRVHDTAPVVEIFAFVVRGAIDKERAAFEVAVLNRDTRLVKFVLLDDCVVASVQLPATPFAPRQLRAVLVTMADVVDRVDDDLQARVGGRRGLDLDSEDELEGGCDEAFDDEGDGEDEGRADAAASDGSAEQATHPALATLLHLDPHGAGDVEPELAASVCEFDRDLVLRLLTESSTQEIEWRKSGNHALLGDDHDEAEVCFGEARAWQATHETLRRALRVIVERQRDEAAVAHARVVEDRSRRTGGRRHAPRSMQQSFVDETRLRRDITGQGLLFEQRANGDEEPEVS